MISNTTSWLTNWIPYQLSTSNGEYFCKWLYTAGMTHTEPFFDESVAKCLAHPFNYNAYKPYSNINVLPLWAEDLNSISPTAFIFHVSRCGSTLISQSLSLNSRHIVLPEAPFIDDVLRLTQVSEWPFKQGLDDIIKATIRIYGQNADGSKQHLFIKADSWHIHMIPWLRRLYPEVPFILLYRRPDEVIRSHQKLRGMQAVPGIIPNELLGIDPGSINPNDFDGHMAKVLESYFKAFIHLSEHDPLTMLVNYNQGITDMVKNVCDFTGVMLDANDWEQISHRSRFNAKYPQQIFNEVQPEDTAPLYQQQAFEHYRRLEQLRTARTS